MVTPLKGPIIAPFFVFHSCLININSSFSFSPSFLGFYRVACSHRSSSFHRSRLIDRSIDHLRFIKHRQRIHRTSSSLQIISSEGSQEVNQMESSMKKLTCTEGESQEINEMEWVLWTGGSWVDESGVGVEEYKGDTLVKRVLHLPSNLTCEVLLNCVRREVALSMEERLKLTYKRPFVSSSVEFLPIDIVDDQDFKYFMEVLDRLPKPVTLYHEKLNGCTKKKVDPEHIHIQVPHEKVGVLIGKGGETVKNLETSSGALIGVLHKNGKSKELTFRVTGERRQIEMVKEMIEELMDREEVYEVEILLFSGGAWDRDVEPREYKGDNVVKHALKVPSNFTWAVLEGQVRATLGLSLVDTFNLTYPLHLGPSDPRKVLPVRVNSDVHLVQFLWFKSAPMTLYVNKCQ